MEYGTVNTNSKGVFPTNGEETSGTIQPIKVVPRATATVIEPVIAIKQEQKQDISENNEVIESQGDKTGITYAIIETKTKEGEVSGVIELDLISFREKGKENRYLSIDTIGVASDGNQIKIKTTIDNESDFNTIKEFFSNLNWND